MKRRKAVIINENNEIEIPDEVLDHLDIKIAEKMLLKSSKGKVYLKKP